MSGCMKCQKWKDMIAHLFFGGGLCHVACGILVPLPGIEPMASAVEVPHLNHWAAREAP